MLLAGCGELSHECGDASDLPAVPSFDAEAILPLYNDANPFVQLIGDSPTVHADSDAMIEGLLSQFQAQGMGVASTEWTVPIVVADASTDTFPVQLNARWAPFNTLLDVPIPAWSRPDPVADGHLTIIDPAAGLEYDLWQFCFDGENASASWGNIVALDGPGIFPQGLSARGSGFALPNGVIWPQELQAGRIEHALVFSYDNTRSGGPVSPATESDATGSGSNTIPEGARLQLDPALDVTTLGLDPWQVTVAVAMQEYGMILGDDGGGITLYAVHPQSWPEGEAVYDGLLPANTPFALFPDTFPIGSFRVLDFGDQNPDASEDAEITFSDRFE